MLEASRAHLTDCGESYTEHRRAALRVSCTLFGAALACTVHAFVPGLFMRTASTRVAQVHASILARRAASASPPGGSELQKTAPALAARID